MAKKKGKGKGKKKEHLPSPLRYGPETITPDKAVQNLENAAPNRDISWPVVASYASDILGDRWRREGPQPVTFDLDGKMIDGGHRMWAIIQADKAITVIVCRGAERETQKTMDVGRPRTAAGIMQIEGQSNCFFYSAVARAMVRGGTGSARVSIQSVIACVAKYNRQMTQLFSMVGITARHRSAFYAPLIKTVIAHGADDIKVFCDQIRQNTFPEYESPGNWLMRWLATAYRPNHTLLYSRVVTAINAQREGKNVRMFRPALPEVVDTETICCEFRTMARMAKGTAKRKQAPSGEKGA